MSCRHSPGLAPGLVTLLIGVNDVVQGVPPDTYASNVATILDGLLALLPADRIVTDRDPGLHRDAGRIGLRGSAAATRRDRGE